MTGVYTQLASMKPADQELQFFHSAFKYMLKPRKLLWMNRPTWPVRLRTFGKIFGLSPSADAKLNPCLIIYLQLSSKVGSLTFGLHLLPYFVYASNKASGKTRL